MTIIELTNVARKDNHIYYRREYKADARYEVMTQTKTVPIEFSIEHTPMGETDVSARIAGKSDLPVLPFLTKLKQHIVALDKKGALP